MAHTVKLTKEIFESMMPARRAYQSTSLPTKCGSVATWGDGESFVIEADVKAKTITGNFLEWNPESDNPDDMIETAMTAEQIIQVIRTEHLIFA